MFCFPVESNIRCDSSNSQLRECFNEHKTSKFSVISFPPQIAKLAKDELEVDLRSDNVHFCLGPRSPGCVTWLSDRVGLKRCVRRGERGNGSWDVEIASREVELGHMK